MRVIVEDDGVLVLGFFAGVEHKGDRYAVLQVRRANGYTLKLNFARFDGQGEESPLLSVSAGVDVGTPVAVRVKLKPVQPRNGGEAFVAMEPLSLHVLAAVLPENVAALVNNHAA